MFRRMIKVQAAGLTILALAQITFGQTTKATRIDDLVRPFVQTNQFSGVVLASENGKVIYEKAFGHANADFKIPNATDTRIGIASITKLMTSVILTRLLEEKRISMEDKLTKYIPDFPNGDKITIQMLATHRAGIPHRVMPTEQESVPHSSADMVERIKQTKLLFEPGTRRTYSSGGYTLLARVLEIASGKSYARLLDEYVFKPAAMRDSLDFESERIIDRRAQDYLADHNGPINAALKDYSFLVGAGSVFGTAGDLNRFGEAIVDGKYGELVKTALVGAENVSGSGSTNGHRAFMEVEKGKKYGFVLLANVSSGAFDIITQGIRDIMRGKEVAAAPFVLPKIMPGPNGVSDILGRYRSPDGTDLDVTVRNSQVYAGEIKLYPTAPDCFFEYKFYGTACFVREQTGKVKGIEWKGTNFNLAWTRL